MYGLTTWSCNLDLPICCSIIITSSSSAYYYAPNNRITYPHNINRITRTIMNPTITCSSHLYGGGKNVQNMDPWYNGTQGCV